MVQDEGIAEVRAAPTTGSVRPWVQAGLRRGLYGLILFLVLVSVASLPRHIRPPRGGVRDTWGHNMMAALSLFAHPEAPAHRQVIQDALGHVPLTLGFIVFAVAGAYLFGILKGLCDVFLVARWYRGVQAVCWVVDALPLFGLVILVEMGTLFLRMFWRADPVHMLPDETFWGGTAVCAVMLTWGPGMYVARVLAVTLRQQFGERYVLTALGKGLRWREVIFRHILKNALPKLAIELPAVYTMAMSGLVAVEFIGMRQHGAVFGALQALGHAGLGFSTLWTSPGEFQIAALTAYLTMFTVFTAVMRGIGWWAERRWRWMMGA